MTTNVTEAAILGWNVKNTYVNMTGWKPRWNIPGYYYQYPDSFYNYDYYHNESYLAYWFDATLENKNIIGSIYVITSAIQFLLYVRILKVRKAFRCMQVDLIILQIIIVDKDLYSLPAYKLIVHLGFADIISIISNFIYRIFHDICDRTNKSMGLLVDESMRNISYMKCRSFRRLVSLKFLAHSVT